MSLYNYLNPTIFLKHLPAVGLIFLLLLILVSIYVLDRSVVTTLKLRKLSRGSSHAKPQIDLERLCDSIANVRQALRFAFYTFGCCLFLMLCRSLDSVATSSKLNYGTILWNFGVDFTFAVDVCLIFLFLHIVQWVVSVRLNQVIRRPLPTSRSGSK